MDIDLVIFDCDGVLVDSETITSRTIADCLQEQGVAWGAEVVGDRFRGGRMQDILTEAEVERGGPLPADFVPRFRERLFARLAAEVEPVPGVHEALDGLEALGLPFCVASNGPQGKMEATLGRTRLLPRFGARIFSAYDLGVFKPNPDLFLHAARTMGAADPTRVAVVEDTETGLQAARAAGMHVIAYVGHGVPMETRAAHRLERMAELPALLRRLGSA
ncbi:MAG: HAD family hydrolase [Planctomycetota bacterium]|nr:HAD family hydrolase [Planctomycetota bacterium]